MNITVRNVQFRTVKDADKHSTWSAHFTGCAREVIRLLEFFAEKNPDRWVYITDAALTKRCNGRFRVKGKGKGYSLVTVRKVLRSLRKNGIVSRELGIAPDGMRQKGYIIAPHDALCRRHPRSCNFVGVGDASGTFVIRKDSATWVRSPESDTSESLGLVVERTTETNSVRSGLRSGSGAFEDHARDHIGDTADESETFAFQADKAFSKTNSVTGTIAAKQRISSPILVSELSPLSLDSHSTPPKDGGDVSLLHSSLTHKTVSDGEQGKGITVKSHFENCADFVQFVSDGLYAPQRVEIKMGDDDWRQYRKRQRQEKLDADHQALCSAVKQAVEQFGDRQLLDRRTLAEIMNLVISTHGALPPGLFKVMKDFQEQGGKITLVKKQPEPEKPLTLWSDEWVFAKFSSFTEAWQRCCDDPNVPREKLDEWYDRDASEDKSAAPWRSSN